MLMSIRRWELTELDDKARPNNPFNAFQYLFGLRHVSLVYRRRAFNAFQYLFRRYLGNLWYFTSSELKKPGIASKNFSSVSSSPRALIDQRKMRRSIEPDRPNTIPSALFSRPPIIMLKRLENLRR